MSLEAFDSKKTPNAASANAKSIERWQMLCAARGSRRLPLVPSLL
jgi:hypothetical protein